MRLAIFFFGVVLGAILMSLTWYGVNQKQAQSLESASAGPTFSKEDTKKTNNINDLWKE